MHLHRIPTGDGQFATLSNPFQRGVLCHIALWLEVLLSIRKNMHAGVSLAVANAGQKLCTVGRLWDSCGPRLRSSAHSLPVPLLLLLHLLLVFVLCPLPTSCRASACVPTN